MPYKGNQNIKHRQMNQLNYTMGNLEINLVVNILLVPRRILSMGIDLTTVMLS